MRKTDKKIDNQIRQILTELCEDYFERVSGFKWLTHLVDYSNFPSSLKVICIFEQQSDIDQFLSLPTTANVNQIQLLSVLNKKLMDVAIKIKKLDKLMLFDNETSCLTEHDGNWANRLKTSY